MGTTLKFLSENTVRKCTFGKSGKCCCGCSGTHRYASAHREVASSWRGYVVADEEINDVQVRRVCRKIAEFPGQVEVHSDHVALDHEGRLLIAYFVPSK